MAHSLDALYTGLEEAGIRVVPCRFEENKCLSLRDGKLIGLDRDKLSDSFEEYTILMHEEGHFSCGAFYYPHSPAPMRWQAEWRANKAAILKHIPWREVRDCMERGIGEVWELAEHFHVTEEFMGMALDYYREQELA